MIQVYQTKTDILNSVNSDERLKEVVMGLVNNINRNIVNVKNRTGLSKQIIFIFNISDDLFYHIKNVICLLYCSKF